MPENSCKLSCQYSTYLADLNEQAQNRLALIIEQMKTIEGVTENPKAVDQMAWVSHEHHPQPVRGDQPPGTDLWGCCCMNILEKFWYGNIEPT